MRICGQARALQDRGSCLLPGVIGRRGSGQLRAAAVGDWGRRDLLAFGPELADQRLDNAASLGTALLPHTTEDDQALLRPQPRQVPAELAPPTIAYQAAAGSVNSDAIRTRTATSATRSAIASSHGGYRMPLKAKLITRMQRMAGAASPVSQPRILPNFAPAASICLRGRCLLTAASLCGSRTVRPPTPVSP